MIGGKNIRNIIQKVIRSIELKGDHENNIVKYIENDKNVRKYKHTVNDSELIRAIEAIDNQHIHIEQYGKLELVYVEGLISVNVRYNIPKYNILSQHDGILILQHWEWVDVNKGKKDSEGKDLEPKFKLLQCFDCNKNPIIERFKRVIVGSGYNRGKPIIFAEDYFKRKVREDIKGIISCVLSGKLYITGNYQVLTPDIYALAQYAFGKCGEKVTGLLQSEEIYASWWIYQNEKSSKKEKDKDEFVCDKLALIRNPHIYMEARIATMVSDKDKK